MCFSTIEQAESYLAELVNVNATPDYVRRSRLRAIQDIAYYHGRTIADVAAEFDQRDAERAAAKEAAKTRTTAYVNDFLAQLNEKIADDQKRFARDGLVSA
jgi:hypothetical protein